VSRYSTPTLELKDLRELSIRLGRDPLLVQGSTGNTSIKIGDSLWIKASGKWLRDAEDDDFLIPVSLTAAMRYFTDGQDIPETAAICADRSPSIETAMHAVLPHRVVVHVHSVNAIAWAVRQDGPEKLAVLLRDLNWKWIPYTPSGISLAQSIHAELTACPETNVFVLGNHGLVVCEHSCRSVEQLLAAVESRLAITPRTAPKPHAGLLTRGFSESGWSLPACREVHALATDQLSRQILSGGVLYPCQAMFLPDTVPRLASSLKESRGQQHPRASVLLIDGGGVLCSKQATSGQLEVLRGLAEVLQRVDQFAPIRYLTNSEVSQVLNGPSYQGTADRDYHSTSFSAAQVQ
jgi:rhamnose utilization protein RhaD (predicted bifunctional aldolase and dehydrogenase)